MRNAQAQARSVLRAIRVLALVAAVLLASGNVPAAAQDRVEPVGAAAPDGGLLLITEENPPYNFTHPETGSIVGVVGELITPLMTRARVPYRLTVMPWSRGYRMAQSVPGVCVFSANMLPERLPLFAWVAPVTQGSLSLFARGDWTRRIDGPADLAGLRVLVQADGAAIREVERLGMIPVSTQLDNKLRMFLGGRGDLIALGGPVGRWYRRSEGLDIKEVYQMQRSDLGIACHLDTDAAVLGRLRAALESMRADGTVEAVAAGYR